MAEFFFPSQRLKRIKEGKFSESSKFLMKQNLFQQFQSFDSSAKLPGLKWPRTKSTYANSQLLQRNLVTAQGLSELISIQMTKQPYSRISIFKGSMYRGFFQLWQRLKIFLDEKKMPRPLGIRIECTGRWEGRDDRRNARVAKGFQRNSHWKMIKAKVELIPHHCRIMAACLIQ